MAHEMQIPTVDLAHLSSPRQEERQRAVDAIREGFGTYGLVYIRNHGVDLDRLEAFYEAYLAFTDRPDDEKAKLGTGDIWYQRGWTPPNTEKAVIAGGQPDFKECYFITPYEHDDLRLQNYPELYAHNVWPEDADDFDAGAFQEHYLRISRQLQSVGESLLRGCALALDLEAYLFEELVDGGPHVTRALRYIPLDDAQVGTDIVWGEEHTDFNTLTILPGGRFLDPDGQFSAAPDGHSGLYLRTRPSAEHPHGVKLRGKAPEGCIIAQVGQQLEILTGGQFVATPHVIEAPQTPGYSRVSMAHFVHMHSHELLYPLEPFQTGGATRSYGPPVLAGTYSMKTLVDIGLAPAEALDRLGYTQYAVLDTIRRAEAGA